MTTTTLVTGGAGFIGSHAADRLAARGGRVIVLDDLTTGRVANLGGARATGRVECVAGDVRDADLVARLVARADRVIHLAAVVGMRRVLAEPVLTMDVNVRGTQNVVAACARRRTPVLVASSSEVCGRGRREPFREDDPLALGPASSPRWTYAASKLAAEHAAMAHHRETGLPVRVARLFNTSGARQLPDHGMVLPRFAEQALAGGPLTVHGDGRQTRTFCHVDDAVDALLALLDAPAAEGRVVHVGGAGETGILALAERVRDAAGTGAPIVHVPHAEVYGEDFEDVARRAPDLSLLRALTGLVPRRTLDETVADAIAWARTARAAVA